MSGDRNQDFDSELVIGLVCAVGTETGSVVDLLIERLDLVGYETHVIKISTDVIPELVPVPALTSDNYFRVSELMNAGNAACRRAGNKAVLAAGAASQIFDLRPPRRDGAKPAPDGQEENETRVGPLAKTAFIIDSLKRPEEVEALRLTYPSGFVLVGVHEAATRRQYYLMDTLGMLNTQADELIERDAEESRDPYGQRVNKTFHLADFFVKISRDHDRLRADVARMVDLWFGNPFITPTFDEHAMFMAFSAALRSADLSRQVGAVVTKESQILSTGANDCPRAGGGLYWPTRDHESGAITDQVEGRDYMRGHDSNRVEQNSIIRRIVEEGVRDEYGFDEDKLERLLDASLIRDLTEYGRVVHAEMEAILSCARSGLSTVGATLYCTTFPCHNCAKHIVAAGIARVVYIEPYPKSKALEFHNDSVTTDEEQAKAGLVFFDSFVGIGPRRFFDLFSMQQGSSYRLKRKDSKTGDKFNWSPRGAQLRIQMQPASYLDLEAEACTLFRRAKSPQVSTEDEP